MYRGEVAEMIDSAIAAHEKAKHKSRKKRETPVPEGFEAFWAEWTKKSDRAGAEAEWIKISPGPLLADTIVKAAREQQEAFRVEWAKDKQHWQPHARKWLKWKRWTDRIESGVKPKAIPKVTLCACGCRREANNDLVIDGKMYHIYKCWWDQKEGSKTDDTSLSKTNEMDPNGRLGVL